MKFRKRSSFKRPAFSKAEHDTRAVTLDQSVARHAPTRKKPRIFAELERRIAMLGYFASTLRNLPSSSTIASISLTLNVLLLFT